jgi:DNA-binding transcriptional LysR family regulator
LDLFASMEAFCRVVETGSLGKAAQRMGVAKSMVATRVQQLEKRLGVPLFHRSTRAMKLSEAGRKYYVDCSELLQRAMELGSHRDDNDAELTGKLAVQVLPGFAIGPFSTALVDFCNLPPGLTFELTVSDKLVDPVNEGFDLVFQIYPPVSDALIERRLFAHRGIFCASPEYLAGAPPLDGPEDLIRHRFARYSNYPWDDRWPFFRGEERIEVKIAPVLKTNSVHVLLDVVLHGGGVGYLPTMLAAPDLEAGRLVRVLTDWAPPQLWLSAVYPASHRSTTKVKTFLEFIARRFPNEPTWDRQLFGEGSPRGDPDRRGPFARALPEPMV